MFSADDDLDNPVDDKDSAENCGWKKEGDI